MLLIATRTSRNDNTASSIEYITHNTVKPMTHTPEISAETRRRFFVPDCIWYEKSAPKINRKNTQPTGARIWYIPEKSGTRSVWHTVQTPEVGADFRAFGAEFRRRNLDTVSSALAYTNSPYYIVIKRRVRACMGNAIKARYTLGSA